MYSRHIHTGVRGPLGESNLVPWFGWAIRMDLTVETFCLRRHFLRPRELCKESEVHTLAAEERRWSEMKVREGASGLSIDWILIVDIVTAERERESWERELRERRAAERNKEGEWEGLDRCGSLWRCVLTNSSTTWTNFYSRLLRCCLLRHISHVPHFRRLYE